MLEEGFDVSMKPVGNHPGAKGRDADLGPLSLSICAGTSLSPYADICAYPGTKWIEADLCTWTEREGLDLAGEVLEEGFDVSPPAPFDHLVYLRAHLFLYVGSGVLDLRFTV